MQGNRKRIYMLFFAKKLQLKNQIPSNLFEFQEKLVIGAFLINLT